MTLQIVNDTLSVAGVAVDLGATDSLLVGRNGLVASTTGSTAVWGTGSNQWVRNEGTLVGDYGIVLGDNGITLYAPGQA